MKTITERQTTYELKKEWKDFTRSEREILTEKNVLDSISEFVDYEEDTEFNIHKEDNSYKTTFTRKDFIAQNEKLNLNFFMLTRKVKQLNVFEELVNTGKDISYNDKGEEKTRKEIIVKYRVVEIIY